MMRAGLLCVVALLTGCLSQPRTPEPALYDLGIAPGGRPIVPSTNAEPSAVRIRTSARSWLDNTAMHYRLVYVDPMRILTYAYARWVAPPAELVGQRLRQRLTGSGTGAGLESAHEIDIDLEEYVQLFETPTQSFGRVTAHVRLLSGTSTKAATFTEQVAAQTPDAVGGVRALAAATDVLIGRIVDWIVAGGDQAADAQLRLASPAAR
jgi:cholesterol transport system auxiliary component